MPGGDRGFSLASGGWWPGALNEDVIDDAVVLLASVTGWQPDALEALSVHMFSRYFEAAQRKKLIGKVDG